LHARHAVFGKYARSAAGDIGGHHHRERRALRSGSNERDVFAVAG